ncbi:MAG TPA: HNH endonuclease [Bellilinea sp.]|nr:HNH endonuclease [Bellilinea sp.]
MLEIDCPEYSALKVFEECIPVKRNKDLKTRLAGVTRHITAAETAYKEKAKTLSFHEIKTAQGIGESVTTAEMEDLYVTVFARKSSPVRKKYYDELMLIPENGTCPMCGQRDVSTLDHYLPKAKNPGLAVTPINLVPVCKECNHTKWEYHPETADQQFIHPYFDKLPESMWLVADLDQTRPPALKYHVSPPQDCGAVLAKRLIWHFEELNLAKLYASQAGKILAGIADKLKAAWQRGGKDEVRFVLSEDARSWSKANPNSWQAVMYRTLASSDWFCEEGYAYAGEKHKCADV